jgi:hypothetical protein
MRFFPGGVRLGAVRRMAVALTCAAAMVLAGCANASPGVVAYVGDARITPKQVDSAVAAVSSTAQEGQTVSKEAVINAMIQGELSAQIAAEQHITITDADRDAFIKTTNLAPLLNVTGAKPILYDVADQSLVAKKVGAAAYLSEIEKRKVTLNPRYGVLDPKQKTIVTDQSSSLSEPGAVQTP